MIKKDIELPASLKYICSYSFRGCTGLTEITIPSHVETVYSFAFSGCNNLKTVIMPECTFPKMVYSNQFLKPLEGRKCWFVEWRVPLCWQKRYTSYMKGAIIERMSNVFNIDVYADKAIFWLRRLEMNGESDFWQFNIYINNNICYHYIYHNCFSQIFTVRTLLLYFPIPSFRLKCGFWHVTPGVNQKGKRDEEKTIIRLDAMFIDPCTGINDCLCKKTRYDLSGNNDVCR